MNNEIDSLKYWRKVFFVEIGASISYPSQEERWAKYGEPLDKIFSLFFDSPILFGWFPDKGSQSLLDGITVTCLQSRFKWEESQNDLVDLGLLAILSNKVNELFTKLGASWAAVTGVFSHPDPTNEVFVALSGTNVPALIDPVITDYPIYLILQPKPRKYLASYIGGGTFCRRLFGFSAEQILEMIAKGKDIHILGGFPSLKFGERENPIIKVLAKEMSYKQAVKILKGKEKGEF
jgi:hypothetical protein